tara:strand:- start:104920 stop:105600 length:681 start_codon:yes stop_codon:yes gene_type:complete
MNFSNFFSKYRTFILIFLSLSIFILSIIYYLLTPAKILPIYQPAEVNYKLVDSSLQHIKKYHKIANFSLLNQSGEKITLDNYNDKIFVADFFFTKCPSICPIMTNNMLELQKKIIADDSVMIISFSVDPKNDTVEQLNNYAQEKGIDQKKWNLLTGDKSKIYDLARKSFFVAELDKKDDNEIIHTENFVLVDPDKRIRGYYDGTNIDEVLKILDDIKTLKNEYNKF